MRTYRMNRKYKSKRLKKKYHKGNWALIGMGLNAQMRSQVNVEAENAAADQIVNDCCDWFDN